jgi:tetratricopeptide (TPR) repeat protein
MPCFAGQDKNEDLFKEGNYLYSNRQYDIAISKYNEILGNGYESAALYYNLGNAYYKAGKMGYSILYFEKAKKLEPKNKEIRNNLLFLQKKVKNVGTLPDLPLYNAIESIENAFSMNFLTVLCYIIFVLLLGSISFYIFAGKILFRKISFFAGIGILVCLIMASSLLVLKYRNNYVLESAIVITNSAQIKFSPDSESRELFPVYEGERIEIKDQVSGWVKIKAMNGKEGWIRFDLISKI